VLTGCNTKPSVTATADNCCIANKDSFNIIMNIPVKIKPEFVSAYKTAFDKCQAETLKEEACLAYDLFQSYKERTEFHLFEKWTNRPGHKSHMQTEHLKVFFKEIADMQVPARTKMIEVTVCPKINN
jgi:quinol monooxygenase YgiN